MSNTNDKKRRGKLPASRVVDHARAVILRRVFSVVLSPVRASSCACPSLCPLFGACCRPGTSQAARLSFAAKSPAPMSANCKPGIASASVRLSPSRRGRKYDKCMTTRARSSSANCKPGIVSAAFRLCAASMRGRNGGSIVWGASRCPVLSLPRPSRFPSPLAAVERPRPGSSRLAICGKRRPRPLPGVSSSRLSPPCRVSSLLRPCRLPCPGFVPVACVIERRRLTPSPLPWCSQAASGQARRVRGA